MNLKNKISLLLIIIITFIVGSSCSKITEKDTTSTGKDSSSKKTGYLSITYTKYNDQKGPENGMTVGLVKYDIDKKISTEMMSMNYSSQYPLGVISMRDNKIYYTAGSKLAAGNDELFSYDIATKKSVQLTEGLFAINYILPRDKDIIIVGVKRGTSAIRLIRYDKQLKKIFYNNLNDDDTCVEYAGIDTADSGKIYTVTYSDNSRRKSSELQALGKADHYIIPTYIISEYHEDISNSKNIAVIDSKIVRSVSGNGKYLLTKEVDNLELDRYKLYIQDMLTNNKKEIILQGVSKYKDLQIDKYGEKIYFIGILNNSDERSVFSYDLKSKKIDKIFTQNKSIGFINNFKLIYE